MQTMRDNALLATEQSEAALAKAEQDRDAAVQEVTELRSTVQALTDQAEQAKPRQEEAVERARDAGRVMLANELVGGLKKPLSDMRECLDDEPSEGQAKALRARFSSVLTILKNKQVDPGVDA